MISKFIDTKCNKIKFHTLSGEITVDVIDDLFEMDFPKYNLNEIAVTDKMTEAIGVKPIPLILTGIYFWLLILRRK